MMLSAAPAPMSRATTKLVEAELVALDVLHHQARFIVLVRRQQA
jgi:hypothetical protein